MRSLHTATAADWQAAADIVGEAAAAETLHELGDNALLPLHRLFHSEFTTFDLYNERGQMVYFRHFPAVDMSALVAPFVAHFHEHPVTGQWERYTQRGLIMHLSEHLPVSRFLRSGLFNEVYLHQNIKYQIGFAGPVDARSAWSIATGRLSADYGPREMELSRFLRPQLARLVGRVARRERATKAADALRSFFDSALVAYALATPAARFVELSATARLLLEKNVPGGLPDPTHVPPACAELRNALARERVRPPPDDRSASAQTLPPPRLFEIVRVGYLEALLLRPLDDSTAVVIFQAPADPSSPRAGPRLTRRESEILAWLGEGKTNIEIAALLAISPRTVEKHCENLFAKLGVETRLGAALLGRSTTSRP